LDIAILTDSTCCLHPGYLEEIGIEMVPARVLVNGQSYRDWAEIQPESVYVALYHKVNTQTRPPHIEDFLTAYENLLNHHDRVLSIHSSLDLSLTLMQANMAARQISPARIQVVDSQSISGGLAAQVLRAWELLSRGLEEATVLAELDRLRRRSSFLFTLSRVERLIEDGKLEASARIFETYLGLSTILRCEAGVIRPMQPVVQEKLLETLIATASQPFANTAVELTIVHSDAALDLLADFNQEIEKNNLDIHYMRLLRASPSLAVHAGEGGLGIYITERFE